MQRNYVTNRVLCLFLQSFLVLFFMTSCGLDNQRQKKQSGVLSSSELLKANKQIIAEEEQHIHDFLNRYEWPVVETGSGLRYYISKHANDGPNIEDGDKITYSYESRFLTGDLVYSSRNQEPISIVMPDGETISGLLEAFKYLTKGDEAKIIIPSRLAHGVAGDGKKIPPYATLVYDVKILDVKKPLIK